MISTFYSRLVSYAQISMFSVMIWTRAAAMVVLITLLISEVAGQSTSFTFNSTSGINNHQGAPMFNVSRDARVDAQGNFLALNTDIAHQVDRPAGPNCGRVVYKDKVRLRDKTNPTVTSFHTSFTFSFASFDNDSTSCGQGMLFMFSNNSDVGALENSRAGTSLCALNRTQADLRLFAVEFDSQFNPVLTNDTSDSHISLDVGNNTLRTHDLCQPANTNQTCAFFCKDPNAMYTAWIDYNSANQTLQVWFRNGSGGAKLGDPVISYPNLRLDTMLDDEMYVGFIGSTGDQREVHTIWAWEFSTTGSSSEPTSKSGSIRMIGGISAGTLAGLLVAGIIVRFCWIHRKMSKAQAFYELPLHIIQDESRSYTFKELSEMTKGFSASEKLSSGGCGDVYKGMLPSGVVVAVKRIKDDEAQAGEASFLAEVRSLRQTRHRNLLQLRGWSYSAAGMFLVYEFMCNGSLHKWLHPNGELNWDVRRAILAGVASGLEYLHEDGMKCVLHRDIKSDNVLLDADFNPYLGDFGLARVVDHRRKAKTTRMAGTFGYMAPEMLHTGQATKETDVYAFGVLALEVVTGRKPARMQDDGGLEMLVDSVWRAHESECLESVVDPRLEDPHKNQEGHQSGDQGIHDEEELELKDGGMFPERVLKVGLLCCLPDPSHRPSMRLVNQWFQSASEGIDMVLPELPEVQPRYGGSPIPMPLFSGNSEPSTSFRDVPSSFRDVSSSFRDVSSSFRDVSSSFRDVSSPFRDVSSSFRDVSSSFSSNLSESGKGGSRRASTMATGIKQQLQRIVNYF